MKVNPKSLLLAMSLTPAFGQQQPNFIIMQPDDLEYFEEWMPAAHFPRTTETFSFADYGLPNMERLRTQGLHLKQAYTTSPVCGTSRYSTMTGRYPSRAATSRNINGERGVSSVTIPTTKLQDVGGVEDGNDCSQNNLAAVLSASGYRTGVVGKWHLANTRNEYDYDTYTQGIRDCGFDFAEAIYAENLSSQGFNSEGLFSHNLEYIAEQAVSFIKSDPDQPFFLYVNPTAPHSSGSVIEALQQFTCRQTPAGELGADPMVPGMTETYGNCEDYRQTIIDRAEDAGTQEVLGAIWVDDTVGALLQALEETNQLDNTFFLFQMDHGNEGKGTLYEPGLRLAQFVHYPNAFGTSGMSWDGIVSTIDIGATVLDFAGVAGDAAARYEMDGVSWRDAVTDTSLSNFWIEERCVAFELDQDRAMRCGCDKYMTLTADGSTIGQAQGNGLEPITEALFDLCGGGRTEILAPGDSPEETDISSMFGERTSTLQELLHQHLDRTNPSAIGDFTPLQEYPVATPDTTTESAPKTKFCRRRNKPCD